LTYKNAPERTSLLHAILSKEKYFCLNVLIQGIFRYGPESLEFFCRNLLKWCHDLQHNIIQHNDTRNRGIICGYQHKQYSPKITFSIITVCHCAEYHYVEFHVLFIDMLKVIMLSAIMQSLIILNAIMLSVALYSFLC